MAEEGHSVVLHYDQAADELVIFSIPTEKALGLRAKSGFELPLKTLRRMKHDEGERRVGAGILNLVESFSGTKLGLRDYETEFQQELERWIADSEKEPQTPEVQAHLAALYRDLAHRKKSRDLLARSRTLTEAAAKGGVADAVWDLEHWDIFERQFERRSKG